MKTKRTLKISSAGSILTVAVETDESSGLPVARDRLSLKVMPGWPLDMLTVYRNVEMNRGVEGESEFPLIDGNC